MPFYMFQLEVNLPPQTVVEKLQSVTRKRPGLFKLMANNWKESDSNLFWGSVQGPSFSLERKIDHRNSFLPQVLGRIRPSGAGSRLRVIMFMSPLVAIFMTFWLTAAAAGALTPWPDRSLSLVPLGMFIFGLALTTGAFFPEAFTTRRLIESVVGAEGYKPIG